MGSRLFLGALIASIISNAIAVYVFHDVDADRVGKLNLAYRELMLEFVAFVIVVTAASLFATWIGSMMLRLKVVESGLRLSFALGIAVILIQYPAEYTVRKLNTGQSSDSFLLAYVLLAPVCCAAIVVADAHKQAIHRLTSVALPEQEQQAE